MNCKKGELAIIIKSLAGNEGKIVTPLRLATPEELIANQYNSTVGPVWVIDKKIITDKKDWLNFSVDAWMRPIRDNPGEDETLQWCPVPHKEIA